MLLEQLRRLAEPHNGDEARVVLGCLTGNYSSAAPLKLEAAGIDARAFGITAFGDEAATRPELTRLAMDKLERRIRYEADPRRVIVVGDTPRDVEAAHAHGCVCFAVATGPYDRRSLEEAGADHVVDSLADPSPLLDLVHQATWKAAVTRSRPGP